MTGLRTNLRVVLAFTVAFILNKFVLRPCIVYMDISGFIKTFTFSFPNLCEGIIGTLVLTNIVLITNARILEESRRLKETTIYYAVTLFAAVYVILQELKVHNLGGRNVYDFNDVVFSVIGLILALGYLLVKKPKYVAE